MFIHKIENSLFVLEMLIVLNLWMQSDYVENSFFFQCIELYNEQSNEIEYGMNPP